MNVDTTYIHSLPFLDSNTQCLPNLLIYITCTWNKWFLSKWVRIWYAQIWYAAQACVGPHLNYPDMICRPSIGNSVKRLDLSWYMLCRKYLTESYSAPFSTWTENFGGKDDDSIASDWLAFGLHRNGGPRKNSLTRVCQPPYIYNWKEKLAISLKFLKINHYVSAENRKKHNVSLFFRKETSKHNDIQAETNIKKGDWHGRKAIKGISLLEPSCSSLLIPLFGVCVPVLGPKKPNGILLSQVVLQIFIPLFGVWVSVLGPKRDNGKLCSQVVLQIFMHFLACVFLFRAQKA